QPPAVEPGATTPDGSRDGPGARQRTAAMTASSATANSSWRRQPNVHRSIRWMISSTATSVSLLGARQRAGPAPCLISDPLHPDQTGAGQCHRQHQTDLPDPVVQQETGRVSAQPDT